MAGSVFNQTRKPWASGTSATGQRAEDELERSVYLLSRRVEELELLLQESFNLVSPDGTQYRIIVDNAGVLSTEEVV
jgi:hypothetical protein